MRIKLINDLEIYVMYITDINNSILINKELFDDLKNIYELDEDNFIEIIESLYPNQIDKFKRILNSRQNVGMAREQSESNILEGKSNFTLCIHATRRCNLNCKYCFGGEDHLPKQEITIDMAKKAVDYMVLDYGKMAKMYTIDLAGSGESLLRFEFIKAMEEHCDILRNKTGKKIIITFPTNATLLTEQHIKYFNQHGDILYGISLDGNEKYNSNRIYKNGKSAFRETLHGIEITTNVHCGIAATITHNNENVDEVYDYLYSLKTGDAISTHIVRDFGESDTSIYKIDVENLLMGYRRLAIKMISSFKKGNFDYIKPLLNGDDIFGVYVLRAVQKGMIAQYRCDAGQNRIAVDDKGKLYVCSVMNGNEDFCIGDIYNGIDKEKQSKFTKCNVNQCEKCRDCWCQNICRGECMTISYMTSGKLYEPNEFMCEIKQGMISIAIAFIEYIRLNIPKGYEFLANHIYGTRNNYQTNSAVWATINYLNKETCNVTYHEIASQLECIPVCAKIHDVEEVIKKYSKQSCAVQIRKLSDLKAVHDTLIGCIQQQNGIVEYFIVEQDNEKFRIYSLESSISGMILTDELVKHGLNVFIGPFEELLN